jgi:hypothetical protein
MREPKDVILPNGKTLENELCEDRPKLHGADLSCVNLSGAKLHGADLSCVNLCGADLSWVNLYRVNLYRANLHCVNLHGAALYGANLHGANLYGANLHGADLCGADNIISIGPIGSRADILYAVRWKAGAMVKTGCFWGTLEKFEASVLKTHGKPADSRVSDEYRRAIELIRTWEK